MAKEATEALSRVYEIGVHFVAALPEEKVAEKFEALKGFLVKNDATIIAEGTPSLIDLAYTMVKHVAGKNQKYDTAYFSWIKFELDSEKIAEVKEMLESDIDVLRYIILKTVKENTLHGEKFAEEKRESRKSVAKEEPKEDKALVDKAIDELVNE